MAVKATTAGLLALCNATVDWANDGVYAVLVNGYTFSAAHTAYSNLSSNELAGGGDYAPKALTGKSVSIVSGKVRFDCDDVSFGDPVSIGPADGIAYLVGNAASPQAGDLLLFYESLADVESVNSEFVIGDTTGLYEITVV